jgi:hypothetical protein
MGNFTCVGLAPDGKPTLEIFFLTPTQRRPRVLIPRVCTGNAIITKITTICPLYETTDMSPDVDPSIPPASLPVSRVFSICAHPGEGYCEVSQPHLDRAYAISKPGKGAASFMGPSNRRSFKSETAATVGSSATARLRYRTDDWLALWPTPRPKPM